MRSIRRDAPAVGLAAALIVGTLSTTALAQPTVTGGAGGNVSSSTAVGNGGAGANATVTTVNATATGGAAGSAGSLAMSVASCSATSCSVTLAGNGSTVDVLGTTISFRTIQDGQATLRVGDQDVSCRQGQRVSVGSLWIECTAVTDNRVKFTVSTS
jgi:hypothetical protein